MFIYFYGFDQKWLYVLAGSKYLWHLTSSSSSGCSVGGVTSWTDILQPGLHADIVWFSLHAACAWKVWSLWKMIWSSHPTFWLISRQVACPCFGFFGYWHCFKWTSNEGCFLEENNLPDLETSHRMTDILCIMAMCESNWQTHTYPTIKLHNLSWTR